MASALSARTSAETYLGRKLSDTEYSELIRGTYAEADPGNPTEAAMVTASILNRARSGNQSVSDVLRAPNQFESVTGNPANGHKPSDNFVQGPDAKTSASIEGAIAGILPSVSTKQTDFTSADPAAYGPGDDVGVLQGDIKNGYVKVGGTVFNTAPPGGAQAATGVAGDYRPGELPGGAQAQTAAAAGEVVPAAKPNPLQTVAAIQSDLAGRFAGKPSSPAVADATPEQSDLGTRFSVPTPVIQTPANGGNPLIDAASGFTQGVGDVLNTIGEGASSAVQAGVGLVGDVAGAVYPAAGAAVQGVATDMASRGAAATDAVNQQNQFYATQHANDQPAFSVSPLGFKIAPSWSDIGRFGGQAAASAPALAVGGEAAAPLAAGARALPVIGRFAGPAADFLTGRGGAGVLSRGASRATAGATAGATAAAETSSANPDVPLIQQMGVGAAFGGILGAGAPAVAAQFAKFGDWLKKPAFALNNDIRVGTGMGQGAPIADANNATVAAGATAADKAHGLAQTNAPTTKIGDTNFQPIVKQLTKSAATLGGPARGAVAGALKAITPAARAVDGYGSAAARIDTALAKTSASTSVSDVEGLMNARNAVLDGLHSFSPKAAAATQEGSVVQGIAYGRGEDPGAVRMTAADAAKAKDPNTNVPQLPSYQAKGFGSFDADSFSTFKAKWDRLPPEAQQGVRMGVAQSVSDDPAGAAAKLKDPTQAFDYYQKLKAVYGDNADKVVSAVQRYAVSTAKSGASKWQTAAAFGTDAAAAVGTGLLEHFTQGGGAITSGLAAGLGFKVARLATRHLFNTDAQEQMARAVSSSPKVPAFQFPNANRFYDPILGTPAGPAAAPVARRYNNQ